MPLPVIGIIGLGFLGKEIVRLEKWPHPSWGTNLNLPNFTGADKTSFKHICFNWQENSDWEKLPTESSSLILTVPPVLKNFKEENRRLREWGSWMNRNRPNIQKLIYISSTGVYPSQNGIWDEKSVFESDSLSGSLRLTTEKTLADFFDLSVIRPGAIYGKKRHIGDRIREGNPIPTGNQPVHRIHVSDLARIVIMAATSKTFPAVLNAIDMDAAPTRNAAEWLLNQSFTDIPAGTKLSFKDNLATRKKTPPAEKRFISNTLLTKECGYQFLFPAYREGFRDCYSKA